jgi:hypothetical protein
MISGDALIHIVSSSKTQVTSQQDPIRSAELALPLQHCNRRLSHQRINGSSRFSTKTHFHYQGVPYMLPLIIFTSHWLVYF